MARARNKAVADAFRQTINLIIEKNLSPQAISAKIIAKAEEARAELINAGKASPDYLTYVDNAAYSGAHITGRIVSNNITYQFEYLGEACAFALQWLQTYAQGMSGPSHNSQDSTPYKDSFVIAVNGRPMKPSSFNPKLIKITDEIIIFNSQPYGRKADTQREGKKSHKKWPMPPYIWKQAVAAVSKKYGKTIEVNRFYTVNVPNQWKRKTGNRKASVQRLVEYPAIKLLDGR